MNRTTLTKLGLGIAAPLLALVAAFAITSLVLIVAGDPVGEVWSTILSVPEPRNWRTSSTTRRCSTSPGSRSPSASG